jgi:hypothetical protein
MENKSSDAVLKNELIKHVNDFGIELSDILEAPFLYMTRQHFTKTLTRIELFKKILDIQGSVVECGTYRADSLLTYFHLSNIFEPYSFTRKIIGFDTFTGFPSTSDNDNKEFAKINHLNDVNLPQIENMIKLQEKNKTLPNINKISLIEGNAIKTIPEYIAQNSHLIISLLYLDFDLYEPTKIALEYFLPRVPTGGIVAFDELNQSKWEGETRAFNEIVGIKNVELKKFSFDPHVSYYRVG